MKNKPDTKLTLTLRKENQDLIRHLHTTVTINSSIGTDADFDELWRHAFSVGGVVLTAAKNRNHLTCQAFQATPSLSRGSC